MWFLDIQQWHTFWGKILDWMDAKENAVGGSRMTNTASFCCDQRLRLLLFGDFQGVRYWSIWFSFSFCLQKFSTSQKEDKPSTSCLLPVPKLQILQPYQFLLFFRLGNETILQFRFIPSFPTDFRLVFLDLFLFHPVQINHTMPRSSHPLGPTKMFETRQQEHRSLQSCLIRFAELNQWSRLNS